MGRYVCAFGVFAFIKNVYIFFLLFNEIRRTTSENRGRSLSNFNLHNFKNTCLLFYLIRNFHLITVTAQREKEIERERERDFCSFRVNQ